MKNIKLKLSVTLLFATSLHSIDIPKHIKWCEQQMTIYGENLLVDSTTQFATAGSLAVAVLGYQYYHHNAALVCLDGHPNSRIMHKSQLIYMSYSDFIDTLESLDSYAAVLEFVQQHCAVCYRVSDIKINQFIQLVDDLQKNNAKRFGADVERENQILENFQNNLISIKQNMKDEALNSAINASARANNMYVLKNIIDLFNMFFGKNK